MVCCKVHGVSRGYIQSSVLSACSLPAAHQLLHLSYSLVVQSFKIVYNRERSRHFTVLVLAGRCMWARDDTTCTVTCVNISVGLVASFIRMLIRNGFWRFQLLETAGIKHTLNSRQPCMGYPILLQCTVDLDLFSSCLWSTFIKSFVSRKSAPSLKCQCGGRWGNS